MSNKFWLSALLLSSALPMTGCGGADKNACLEGTDKAALQACNRECARGDQEACAKAKVIEATGAAQQ